MMESIGIFVLTIICMFIVVKCDGNSRFLSIGGYLLAFSIIMFLILVSI